MNATKPQLTKIHLLLTELNLLEDKKDIVSQYTNGKETSSTKMTMQQAAALISALLGGKAIYDPLERMRRKVFALAYDAGFIWGETPEDKRMNSIKLNNWLTEKGAVKKQLNSMDKSELVKTINQFEMIVKHTGESAASKATKSMLDELGITTTASRKVKA